LSEFCGTNAWNSKLFFELSEENISLYLERYLNNL
jgi:hypothetical protein